MNKSSKPLRWSIEEDGTLLRYFAHETTCKVMERLPGRPYAGVASRAYVLGLTKTPAQRKAYLVENRQKAISKLRGAQPWNKKQSLKFECETCGEVFEVPPYRARTARFCGAECRYEYLRRTTGPDHPLYSLVDKNCEWCEAAMKVKPALEAHGRGKFCSQSCVGAWTIHTRQSGVSGAETAFGDALAQAGVSMERQVRIRRWVVDFLVGGKLVLEFDGEYWHSLPKAIERDARKDADLTAAGYEVVRIGERLWIEKPEQAVQVALREVDKYAGKVVSSPIQGRLF